MGTIGRIVTTACAAALLPHAVAAETGTPASASAAASATSALAPLELERPAVITIGLVPDGAGRPVYADRSGGEGTALSVRFSTTPVRQRRAAAAAELAPRALPGTATLPRFLPIASRAMTSGFGARVHPILGTVRNHSGVDLAAPAGTPVLATADGEVYFADWNGGYGIMVAVSHPGGVETRFGHLMRLAVTPGQQVKVGDVVGWVGSTGLTTGPHVHYEVRVGGRPVSPWSSR